MGLLHSPELHSQPWSAAAAKSLQSCPNLCDPIEGSPPGSPVPEILQARTLEWVAISFSKAWQWKVKVKSLSHVQLSDPMDCSPPGSSVHGILQARVLEWGVTAFSDLSNLSTPYPSGSKYAFISPFRVQTLSPQFCLWFCTYWKVSFSGLPHFIKRYLFCFFFFFVGKSVVANA